MRRWTYSAGIEAARTGATEMLRDRVLRARVVRNELLPASIER